MLNEMNFYITLYGLVNVYSHCYSDSYLSRGVSILIRKDLELEVLAIHRSNDCRKLLINVKISDMELTFVNIYEPKNETYRVQFCKRMRSLINIAICGASLSYSIIHCACFRNPSIIF